MRYTDYALACFKDKHLNQHAFIIGKGPHLDRIGEQCELLSTGVVLCCNESVHKIETLGLDCAVYAVQQDECLGDRCVSRDERIVHFLNAWRGKPKKLVESVPYPRTTLYDPYRFGEGICSFTALMACRIALHMGMREATFMCFDSWVPSGDSCYANCIGGVNGPMPRHAVDGVSIRRQAREMGLKFDVKFPDCVLT